MKVITDLHIHSKYSRACSKSITIPNIAQTCEQKGINYIATGDALHPQWRAHISETLEEREDALYLRDNSSSTAFILSTEVSCIYKRGGKTRRLHHVILFPDLKSLDQVIIELTNRKFNLKSDGRPIMGLDSEELIKLLLNIDERILLIPAHAWTPWFAIFGSKSGFDSLEECFGEYTKYIYAIETGLSSDPPMNWQLSQLDKVFLVSNSDAHSLEKLGREANIFEMTKPSYTELRNILVNHDQKKFLQTIEFFPEEGKYHADGHADCGFYCSPAETKKLKGLCPKCGRPLTIGVLSRVSELADRQQSAIDKKKFVPFQSIVPLKEVISNCVDKGVKTKTVSKIYEKIISQENEFNILLNTPINKLQNIIPQKDIVQAIINMREHKIKLQPGYDGVFGKIQVCSKNNKAHQEKLI